MTLLKHQPGLNKSTSFRELRVDISITWILYALIYKEKKESVPLATHAQYTEPTQPHKSNQSGGGRRHDKNDLIVKIETESDRVKHVCHLCLYFHQDRLLFD